MAFDFVKKIFSFGRDRPVEPEQPAALPAPSSLPEPQPAPEAVPPVTVEHREIPPHDPGTVTPQTPELPPVPLEVPPQEPPAPAPVPEVPIEVPAPPKPEPEKPTHDAEPSVDVSLPLEGREAAQRQGGVAEEALLFLQPETRRQAEPTPPRSAAPIDLPGRAAGLARLSDPLKGEGEVAHAVPAPPANSVPGQISPTFPPAPSPAGKITVSKAVERRGEAPAPSSAPRATWLQRLTTGLSRSSRELSDNISGLMTKGKLTDEFVDELEEILIRADLGMETAIRVTGALEDGRYGRQSTASDVQAVMAAEIEKVLVPVALPLELDLSHRPHVILVVGVNGTGKTTTIGKLAAKLTAGGLKVTLAAGDTFRAAAIEQLKIWGERTGSEVVSSKLGADAAGLAYEAFERARAAGSDILLIDTAGRLQNKTELMAELEKIVRVLGRLDPDAPHTVLQTIDATTGQNAMNQVEIFRNVAGVNGLVMTKLDGTARGGILVAIAAKHRLPVYFVGVGEQVDDLEPFSARDFARAIAGVVS